MKVISVFLVICLIALKFEEGLTQGLFSVNLGNTNGIFGASGNIPDIGQCRAPNDDRIETCQRCAKIHKGPRVYRECCFGIDNTWEWCQQFANWNPQRRASEAKTIQQKGTECGPFDTLCGNGFGRRR